MGILDQPRGMDNPLFHMGMGLLSRSGTKGQLGQGLAAGLGSYQAALSAKEKRELQELQKQKVKAELEAAEQERKRDLKMTQKVQGLLLDKEAPFEQDMFPGEEAITGLTTVTPGMISQETDPQRKLALTMVAEDPTNPQAISLLNATTRGKAPRKQVLDTPQGLLTWSAEGGEPTPITYGGEVLRSSKTELAEDRIKQAEERLAKVEKRYQLDVDKEERRVAHTQYKDVRGLQKDYQTATADLREGSMELDRLLAIAERGEPLSDIMLQQGLSNIQASSVRAQAELAKFGNYGSLDERVSNTISKLFSGKITEDTRNDAKALLRELNNKFYKPALSRKKAFYEGIADKNKLDKSQIFEPIGPAPAITTWEDETYQYRKLPDGTTQRKRK